MTTNNYPIKIKLSSDYISDSVIICYENADPDYILDILSILKCDNMGVAPMCVLRDFTIKHIYIRTSDYNIFTPKHAATMLIDYISRIHESNCGRIYLTHDITYIIGDHHLCALKIIM